jgi:hypothetical protein
MVIAIFAGRVIGSESEEVEMVDIDVLLGELIELASQPYAVVPGEADPLDVKRLQIRALFESTNAVARSKVEELAAVSRDEWYATPIEHAEVEDKDAVVAKETALLEAFDAQAKRIADLEATNRDLNEALDDACGELNDPGARIARLEEERDAAVRAEIARGIEVSKAQERIAELTSAARVVLGALPGEPRPGTNANRVVAVLRNLTADADVAPVPRDVVLWFAHRMEMTLREHDDRPEWTCETQEYLWSRLMDECMELSQAIDNGNGVIDEAVDVANFAMMIADNGRGCRE